MIREEALVKIKGYLTDYLPLEDVDEIDEIMLALELQPCDDAISRQEAIRVAEQGQIQGYVWQFKKLCTLPPVIPQQKIGRWEWVQYDGNPNIGNWHCTECKNIVIKGVKKEKKGVIFPLYTYCPNCGTKMQEVDR